MSKQEEESHRNVTLGSWSSLLGSLILIVRVANLIIRNAMEMYLPFNNQVKHMTGATPITRGASFIINTAIAGINAL